MWGRAVVLIAVLAGCLCRSTKTVKSFEKEVLRVVDLNTAPATITGQRIIGGFSTDIEKYPYTVQVLHNKQLTCAGSLLTTSSVLSAAHCFVEDNGNHLSHRLFSIRAGSSTLYVGGEIHAVSRIIAHELYNTPVRDNDIAILLLASKVTLGVNIGLASIPSQGSVVPDNSSVVHVGWGRTNVNIPVPSVTLQEVAVYTVNRDVCGNNYGYLGTYLGEEFPITDSMICAGLLGVGGKDACSGDSGGPLIYRGVVVGVTSWGFSCGEPYFPGVSARVASYTDWINATITANGASAHKSGVIILLVCLISGLI